MFFCMLTGQLTQSDPYELLEDLLSVNYSVHMTLSVAENTFYLMECTAPDENVLIQ